jgi:hypothetical protein
MYSTRHSGLASFHAGLSALLNNYIVGSNRLFPCLRGRKAMHGIHSLET